MYISRQAMFMARQVHGKESMWQGNACAWLGMAGQCNAMHMNGKERHQQGKTKQVRHAHDKE